MRPPTDIEVLDALRLLRSYFASAESSALYSQRDLPPGCASRSAYVRRHRALRAAGVPGVRAVGKTLTCSAEAWAHELPRPRRPAPAVSSDAETGASSVAAALGIRLLAGAR